MPLSAAKDDRAHLHDMLESAQQAASYVSGQTFDQFWDDPKTRDAVAMRLTIVGEAARNVSPTTATAIPAVPFHQIRGLRNRIAHAYDQVDFREVWKITQNDLKPLISELERYLNKLKQQQDEAERMRQIQSQTSQPQRPATARSLGCDTTMSGSLPLNQSLTNAYSPYDPRRFDHLSEEEVIRRIGAILAVALLRSGRLQSQPPKSDGAPVAFARVDQASLLRDDTERQIVSFLQCAGPTSPMVIGRTLDIPQRVITRRLTRLRANGVCGIEGKTRAVRYRVRDDFSGN